MKRIPKLKLPIPEDYWGNTSVELTWLYPNNFMGHELIWTPEYGDK